MQGQLQEPRSGAPGSQSGCEDPLRTGSRLGLGGSGIVTWVWNSNTGGSMSVCVCVCVCVFP